MKTAFRRIGILLGSLLGLVIIGLIGLIIYAQVKFKPTHNDRPLYPITADTSPEGIARGKYLMESAMNCTEACHLGESGTLSGMTEEINEGPISGLFATPNLTPDEATGLGSWSDAEIARAIREGVDKDGVELIIMPAYNYNALSDQDIAAVIGYLRSLPAVENEIPPIELNLAGKIMLALGVFGPTPLQDPITEAKTIPEAGTLAYGEYMVKLGACSDCHKENLAGGAFPFSEPGSAIPANLTPGGELVGWDVEDFILAVTEGVHPTGTNLSDGMPRYTTSEEDLAAIFTYLQSLPALPMNE
jgi:mono/diheme cytochrome c family protein